MSRLWAVLGILGVSMFCGIILVAIAAGAVIPRVIDPIAAPLVCPHGQLQITQNTTSYKPGESDTWTTDTCVDTATGQQQDVSLQTTLAAGIEYSLMLFVIFGGWSLYNKMKSRMQRA